MHLIGVLFFSVPGLFQIDERNVSLNKLKSWRQKKTLERDGGHVWLVVMSKKRLTLARLRA
jgi:hypothetical protein